LQGFRNRIINGDMRIDQRNAGASVTPAAGAYTLDRWASGLTQASKFTVQRSTDAPAGFTNSLLVTSSSAYSVTGNDYFGVFQVIEGYNVADLNYGTASAQTITFSFWVKSSLTGSFGGPIENGAQNRCYSFAYTVSSANTWEYKTVTAVGDTTGTWSTDNTGGMIAWFGLGASGTRVGTAGAWGTQSGSGLQPSGTVSVVGTSGATFYITGVQLEAGSVATPFERRPYGTELALCQRYFLRGYKIFCHQGSSGFSQPLPLTMRSAPTATRIAAAHTGGESVPAIDTTDNSAYIFNASLPTGGTYNLSAEL
jgi:hypothetical protein